MELYFTIDVFLAGVLFTSTFLIGVVCGCTYLAIVTNRRVM